MSLLRDRDCVGDIAIGIDHMVIAECLRICDGDSAIGATLTAMHTAPIRSRAIVKHARPRSSRHATVALDDVDWACRVVVVLLARRPVLHGPRKLIVMDVSSIDNIYAILQHQWLQLGGNCNVPVAQRLAIILF